jgi:hypothetical protein
MSNHETTAALDQNEIDHLIGMCPDWAMHHATDGYPGLSAFLMRCMSAMVAQRTEIERLRRGWLKVIQIENSCAATGQPCDAKRCGCEAERELLANA